MASENAAPAAGRADSGPVLARRASSAGSSTTGASRASLVRGRTNGTTLPRSASADDRTARAGTTAPRSGRLLRSRGRRTPSPRDTLRLIPLRARDRSGDAEANLQPALERDPRRGEHDRRRLPRLALAFGIHVLNVVLVQQVIDTEAREYIRRRLVADIEIDQIVGRNRGNIREPVLVAARNVAGGFPRDRLPAHRHRELAIDQPHAEGRGDLVGLHGEQRQVVGRVAAADVLARETDEPVARIIRAFELEALDARLADVLILRE